MRVLAYPMPNDEVGLGALMNLSGQFLTVLRLKPELERLDLTHTLITVGTGEQLYHAPIDEAKISRILDIGTGTGICMLWSWQASLVVLT